MTDWNNELAAIESDASGLTVVGDLTPLLRPDLAALAARFFEIGATLKYIGKALDRVYDQMADRESDAATKQEEERARTLNADDEYAARDTAISAAKLAQAGLDALIAGMEKGR